MRRQKTSGFTIFPMDDVAESFEELKEYLPAALQSIMDYFSRTWIGDYALFLVQLWGQ